ncbi:NAD(P)/FAD-dependent oxidoreductase [Azospirillum sp.]|uniref:NAD(P)/FAD-dependent oxidoreductase n=1 Tax=Azospirillum sp. TaxID=34012 RepID=UPI002D353292|nr:FAD-dependent oxidoreductase [Azospirillum sp.]HYD70437.1 FAD-dependent oxidoreductase [Azospirillum sp.]
MGKIKVAILGGGVGSLTTAYHLCNTQELRDRFDVTVYQMGWRLGGKGATGRDRYGRIQEHGLHVWFGYYNNAFKMMQDVFTALNPPETEALRTWRDALKRHDFTPIGMQLEDGSPAYWPLTWPHLGGTPGDGNVMPTPRQAVVSLVGLIRDVFTNWNELTGLVVNGKLVPGTVDAAIPTVPDDHRALPEPLARGFRDSIIAWGEKQVRHIEQAEALLKGAAIATVQDAAVVAHRWARAALDKGDDATATADSYRGILWLLRQINRAIDSLPSSLVARDFLTFMVPFATGVISDYIIEGKTADELDSQEFTQWLINHGGVPENLAKCCSLRTCYDTFMQYKDGDFHAPDWAAGVASLSCLRMYATCKEAVLFNMEAGMGEVIVAPIYQLLQQCGVKVKFFRRVEELGLTEDGALVDRIRLAKQVNVIGGDDAYRATGIVRREGDGKILHVWPIEPYWEQIENGAAIKKVLDDHKSNLESHWCPVPPVGEEVLQRGKDFDIAVLGISLGGFKKMNDEPTLAAALQAARPRFNAMTENIGIIPTMSMQLWCGPDLPGLGWEVERPAAVAGPEPWSIWAEMQQTLKYEPWTDTAAPRPKSVHYICGVWKTDLVAQPSTDLSVPARALDTVTQSGVDWLNGYARYFWPKAMTASGFDWNMLDDPANGEGVERFRNQIIRSNVDPTETLPGSAVGSTQWRLRTDESGFYNLYLAGCWIRTGLNTSCVEATVMSGMQAARAISGEPLYISGENWLNGAK